MGVGSSIQEPCLQPGQTLDGSRISRLFACKILWLRPTDNNVLAAVTENSIINVDEKVSMSCMVGNNFLIRRRVLSGLQV